jgi:hypothetical protein
MSATLGPAQGLVAAESPIVTKSTQNRDPGVEAALRARIVRERPAHARIVPTVR